MDNGRDEKGRFLSGHQGKKPPGATSDIRKRVAAFVDERWDELPAWFDSLKPKDKLLFVAELLPFLIPRLKQVESTNINLMELRAQTAALFPQSLKDLGKDDPLDFSQN